jgi:hypothetical protein
MFLAQATTQPAANLWTPGEVAMLMSLFGSVVLGGFFAGWRSIIALKRDAALAIIAAQAAQVKAAEAKTTSDHNSQQMRDVRGELFKVALASPPRPSPVVPTTFADAQLRASADPDCPTPPPQTGEG